MVVKLTNNRRVLKICQIFKHSVQNVPIELVFIPERFKLLNPNQLHSLKRSKTLL